jgi:hypothetical protein
VRSATVAQPTLLLDFWRAALARQGAITDAILPLRDSP